MKLPVDHLIEQMRLPKDLPRKTNTMCLAMLKNLIPLELVKNTTIMKAAHDYIVRLLKDKYNLGYLYYLHSMNKRMLIPLDVEFNGELAIEKERFDQVVEEIDKLASEFAPRDTFIFEITRVELLYFFIISINPDLTWIAVDHILQCVKGHAHLISAPNRIIKSEYPLLKC
ncbi:hypothetical protein AVEN_3106-1 [Araneus ventricosus]|uniref:Uncharacterized protein n=1 Tax=Araneus ventricosus TaxID=182803 RepID=A0A4Y2P9F2_ARAVE|nr:hypothetical protein AVEN_60553-1 [Araneus ventricosus]GBN47672.1 hypothetical protein AVEN_3106-1 [Araneus ventricosus]